MRYINRKVPIGEVARALDLQDGWSRQECTVGTRISTSTATEPPLSGFERANNTVKCFGCGVGPIGPIDLVMDVRGVNAGDAALWIAERFDVPTIPAGKRIEEPDRWRGKFGYERGLGLLVTSGLFGAMSEAARSIAPVLQEMSEKGEPPDQESSIRISYRGISRYSGVQSPNAIRKALLGVGEIGFTGFPSRSPPFYHQVVTQMHSTHRHAQLRCACRVGAHSFSAQMRSEVSPLKGELRDQMRKGDS